MKINFNKTTLALLMIVLVVFLLGSCAGILRALGGSSNVMSKK